jgi:hypothetical protein
MVSQKSPARVNSRRAKVSALRSIDKETHAFTHTHHSSPRLCCEMTSNELLLMVVTPLGTHAFLANVNTIACFCENALYAAFANFPNAIAANSHTQPFTHTQLPPPHSHHTQKPPLNLTIQSKHDHKNKHIKTCALVFFCII